MLAWEKNPLYSDAIRSIITTGKDQPDRSLSFNAYCKKIFFAPFLGVNHGKGETKEPLVSKNRFAKQKGKNALNLYL